MKVTAVECTGNSRQFGRHLQSWRPTAKKNPVPGFAALLDKVLRRIGK